MDGPDGPKERWTQGISFEMGDHMKSPIAMIAAALMLLAAPAVAAEVKYPDLTGPVVDTVDEIPAEQEARIGEKIRAFQKATGHQLQVLTVSDTQDLTISEYGLGLLRTWKIGRAGVDDGMILIHALKSTGGRIRIETGYGSEAYMTDGLSKDIIDETIVPLFKQGQFGDGIEAGVDRMIKEASITPEQRKADEAKLRLEAARRAQADWDGFVTFMGWLAGIVATGFGAFVVWFLATAGRRRRRREAEALQRIADAEAYAAAEKIREQQRADARAAAKKREEEEAQKRADMLAAMTPQERERFLADERAAAEEERAEQARRAAAQAIRDEEERVARQKARERQEQLDREEESRRSTTTYGGGWGSSSSIDSSGSSSSDGWSGGGGSGGGGGASGDY